MHTILDNKTDINNKSRIIYVFFNFSITIAAFLGTKNKDNLDWFWLCHLETFTNFEDSRESLNEVYIWLSKSGELGCWETFIPHGFLTLRCQLGSKIGLQSLFSTRSVTLDFTCVPNDWMHKHYFRQKHLRVLNALNNLDRQCRYRP